jgi:hypothetical protein
MGLRALVEYSRSSAQSAADRALEGMLREERSPESSGRGMVCREAPWPS